MARKVIAGILILVLTVGILSACGGDKKRLEDARQATEQAQQALDDAQAGLDHIYDLKNQYEEIQTQLLTAEKGSAQYSRLVAQNNRLVKQIIKEYPEMAQYVEMK